MRAWHSAKPIVVLKTEALHHFFLDTFDM